MTGEVVVWQSLARSAPAWPGNFHPARSDLDKFADAGEHTESTPTKKCFCGIDPGHIDGVTAPPIVHNHTKSRVCFPGFNDGI